LRFAGVVYRAHNPRWAFAPTSGDGAARYGGRFNPPGVPALYTSLNLETAWFEAQQGFAFKAQPLTICAYEVDCADVIDLTDADTRLAHGVTSADLACAWEDLASRGVEPASWRIAKSLIAGEFAGLIAPSFALGAGRDARNAVFWTWSGAPLRSFAAAFKVTVGELEFGIEPAAGLAGARGPTAPEPSARSDWAGWRADRNPKPTPWVLGTPH
jgi:RES domain-containing protein